MHRGHITPLEVYNRVHTGGVQEKTRERLIIQVSDTIHGSKSISHGISRSKNGNYYDVTCKNSHI